MSDVTEFDSYRLRLLGMLRRLDRDRSQLKDEAMQALGGEASGGLSDVPLHPADLGSHLFEEELTIDLVEKEEHIIEEINGALARIERGVFGRCEACNRPIARKRLLALPYARHCLECARKSQEKGHP
jgi:RNA polymerase-binding transcription factor DksA